MLEKLFDDDVKRYGIEELHLTESYANQMKDLKLL